MGMLLTLQFPSGNALAQQCKVTGPETTLAASLERVKMERTYMILQWLKKSQSILATGSSSGLCDV